MSEDDLLKDQRGSPAYISPDVLSGEWKEAGFHVVLGGMSKHLYHGIFQNYIGITVYDDSMYIWVFSNDLIIEALRLTYFTVMGMNIVEKNVYTSIKTGLHGLTQ